MIPTNLEDKDEASLIWDEYKYRHEHIWQLIFRITASMIALGTLPYLDSQILQDLGLWLFIPPLVSVGLILFAMLRIKRELCVFSQIKKLHRTRQNSLLEIHKTVEGSTFSTHVRWYLRLLLGGALLNCIAIFSKI